MEKVSRNVLAFFRHFDHVEKVHPYGSPRLCHCAHHFLRITTLFNFISFIVLMFEIKLDGAAAMSLLFCR